MFLCDLFTTICAGIDISALVSVPIQQQQFVLIISVIIIFTIIFTIITILSLNSLILAWTPPAMDLLLSSSIEVEGDSTSTVRGPYRRDRPVESLLSDRDVCVLVGLLLTPADVAAVSMTSKTLSSAMRSEDVLWKQLWMSRYSSLVQSPAMRRLLALRRVPSSTQSLLATASFSPRGGWRHFYCAWECGWLNWVAAGCNTRELCVIGVRDVLYDLTPFIGAHPGSDETLLWAGGCDASRIFADVGHSSEAVRRLDTLELCRPAFRPHCGRQFTPSGALRASLRKQLVVGLSAASADYREGTAADAGFHQSHLLGLRPMTALLGPPCALAHSGQCRACLDPLEGVCWVWWSCCGWGAPADASAPLPRSLSSLHSLNSYSSNLSATVAKTLHLVHDIQRSIGP